MSNGYIVLNWKISQGIWMHFKFGKGLDIFSNEKALFRVKAFYFEKIMDFNKVVGFILGLLNKLDK